MPEPTCPHGYKNPSICDECAKGPWRVGSKVPLNVYCGDRPVCQCHNEADARRIVEAMNLHA